MKLRLQGNSVRFRITLRELEQLLADGALESQTRLPGSAEASVFRYRVEQDRTSTKSQVVLSPYALTLVLADMDLAALADPKNEGAYVKCEWIEADGTLHRLLAFIEKDRPAASCAKPEAWIYEAKPGAAPITRPAPPIGAARP